MLLVDVKLVCTNSCLYAGPPDSAKMQFVMERRYSQDTVPAPKAGAKIVTRTEDGGSAVACMMLVVEMVVPVVHDLSTIEAIIRSESRCRISSQS